MPSRISNSDLLLAVEEIINKKVDEILKNNKADDLSTLLEVNKKLIEQNKTLLQRIENLEHRLETRIRQATIEKYF